MQRCKGQSGQVVKLSRCKGAKDAKLAAKKIRGQAHKLASKVALSLIELLIAAKKTTWS